MDSKYFLLNSVSKHCTFQLQVKFLSEIIIEIVIYSRTIILSSLTGEIDHDDAIVV